MTDPTAYEEDMCGGSGANYIVCWNNGFLCGAHKFGSSSLSMEDEKEALKIAKQRTQLIEKLIETCILNENIEN